MMQTMSCLSYELFSSTIEAPVLNIVLEYCSLKHTMDISFDKTFQGRRIILENLLDVRIG